MPNRQKDFEEARKNFVSDTVLSATSTWFLLRQGPNAFDYNMALDEALLESADRLGAPVLRFYGWTQRAASFGYSQKFSDVEKTTLLRPLVRRPTGGGLVPHDADWTYSLVFPPVHFWYRLKATESYRHVHEWLRDAFAAMDLPTTLSPECQKAVPGQCFIGAEKDDLIWHGRKIAGAAQRRTRAGLLVQGSVQPPPVALSRKRWENEMCRVGEEKLGIKWQPLELGPNLQNLQTLAESLRAAKYSRPEFNERR